MSAFCCLYSFKNKETAGSGTRRAATLGVVLTLATVLSLLFMAGTLLALVLALTVGLFGIREVLSFKLVPTTLVVESIGTIILAATVAMVVRSRRAS